MKKFNIKYWFAGNIYTKEIKADTQDRAMVAFYLSTDCTDIISIEEVTDDVV